ncbi:helix-turn-helix transcriptional regulator [uncultured Desulfuromonas sp.]|uniref:helix-turn-helix domain-containing protein n=1 Tax=uncultured Desulfuromonas sp. TaxID=181013 RepID=UPI002AABAC82|nr:helix-turn-helix transcriptional regulator [uncultured Desulfuromonas sp.]
MKDDTKKQGLLEFSQRLKYLRQECLGLSQRQLAKELNLKHQQAFQVWEAGKSEPGLLSVGHLVTTYGVNVNWLITGQGKPFIGEDDSVDLPVKQGVAKITILIEQEGSHAPKIQILQASADHPD